MKNVKVTTTYAGHAIISRDGREIGTVERSAGGPTPADGKWFAYESPSDADMMAHQHDRASRAVAWGATRTQAVEAFLDYLA
ncbi:hypothetical protein [Actinomyces howellii]|uniref:Uncharacterized protein n=1 Tax=Actinomyces howellii TaxID=52771 RepID=A0A3S4RAV2_9ACTO|nr:hypothetical protein [Actinomyces howellii]VEG28071.1 Uncharacterised protein [Actinomyces howellii]